MMAESRHFIFIILCLLFLIYIIALKKNNKHNLSKDLKNT